MVMPFVNVTKKCQVVGRYTAIDSASPNGVRLATYENTVVSGRGDRYNEGYVGANYFFYGHKLKLQSDALAGLLTHGGSSSEKHAKYMRDKVIPAMVKLRETGDQIEVLTPHAIWPLPTYREMLFVK